jgi:hypothetical protein
LGQPGYDICVHGYRVLVKEKTLKRGTSLLKHARFLSNLEVRPKYPAVQEDLVMEEEQEIIEPEDE